MAARLRFYRSWPLPSQLMYARNRPESRIRPRVIAGRYRYRCLAAAGLSYEAPPSTPYSRRISARRGPAMSANLSQLPVHALSAGIAARRFSPVDVVDACLARIAALDPKLHAFVAGHEREARLAAEGADKAIRAGHAVGPLHGIPIALKDLIEIEGQVATGGTDVWRNRVATRTATLARKLIAAGMIVIGKTP